MIANSPRRTRWISGLILLICLAVSLVCVVYPVFVIRPFRTQGAHELALALMVSRLRPAVTVVCAVVGLLALAIYWRAQARWPRRILPAMGAVLTLALAFLARVNIYELMFHPIERASFSPASQVKLDKNEKVIAVRIGDKARAYPIRSMSYHHLINDVVGELAILPTY
jgi:hypothetical protein